MDKLLQKTNVLWGGCVAFLAATFGEFWFLFIAFLVLNIADYATGWTKAYLAKEENSNKGLRGIIKKVGYWFVIAIAFFIAVSFESMGSVIGVNLSFLTAIGWFTLATFIINELRSILENLVMLGVDVPPFLINGLEVAAKTVKSVTDKDTVVK